MIVVTVALVSANGSDRNRQLAQVHIANVGGTKTRGDYSVKIFGPSGKPCMTGLVQNYPRKDVAVLNLVRRAIEAAGYVK